MFNVTATVGDITCHYFNITDTPATTSATTTATLMPTSGSPTAVMTVTVTPFPSAPTTSNLSTQGHFEQGADISAGGVAGIAIGGTLATMMVVGLLGWSIWRQKGRSKATRNEQPSVEERSDTTINDERRVRDEVGSEPWGQGLSGEGHYRSELEDAQRGSQRHKMPGQGREKNDPEDSNPPNRGYELPVESYR